MCECFYQHLVNINNSHVTNTHTGTQRLSGRVAAVMLLSSPIECAKREPLSRLTKAPYQQTTDHAIFSQPSRITDVPNKSADLEEMKMIPAYKNKHVSW